MLPKGAAAKVSQHPTELHLEARNLGVACVVVVPSVKVGLGDMQRVAACKDLLASDLLQRWD